MGHDLARAARGLLRPWWAGLIYGMVAAMPLAALAAVGCPTDNLARVVGWPSGYGILIAFSAVLMRLEEPRARLVPRYRHAAFAAGRLLALAPLALGSAFLCLSAESLSTAAAQLAKAWAIAAVIPWTVAFGLLLVIRRFARAAVVGALLVIYLHLLGPDQGLPATLLRGGLALFALAGLEWYVRALTEEDLDQVRRWLAGKRDGWYWDGAFRSQSADGASKAARRFPAGNGTGALLVRLRAATLCSPWWLTVAGTVVGVAGLASIVFWGCDLLPSAGRLIASAPFALAFCLLTVMLPAMSAFVQMLNWTRCAERIALWPVSRQRLVGGIGATIALQTLLEWGSLAASAAVVVLLFEPSLLLTAWPWQLAFHSFASVVCLAGLGAWALRRWHAASTAIVIAGAAMPSAALALAIMPLAFCASLPQEPTAAEMVNAMPWAALCAGYLALGLAAGCAAWRSWIRGSWA